MQCFRCQIVLPTSEISSDFVCPLKWLQTGTNTFQCPEFSNWRLRFFSLSASPIVDLRVSATESLPVLSVGSTFYSCPLYPLSAVLANVRLQIPAFSHSNSGPMSFYAVVGSETQPANCSEQYRTVLPTSVCPLGVSNGYAVPLDFHRQIASIGCFDVPCRLLQLVHAYRLRSSSAPASIPAPLVG